MMVELSTLEFDKIGRLDWDDPSGMHRIVPFPDLSAFFVGSPYEEQYDEVSIGPLDTAHPFLL